MKVVFQTFSNLNWSFHEELLPLAEPWIHKISHNGFAHRPQQHKSDAACWVFRFSEFELDFFWVVPPKDYLFVDFGFALNRISDMLYLFEMNHLGKKTGVLRSANTNPAIRKALAKRKVQSLFFQVFSTNFVQPYFQMCFWAPSKMREHIYSFLDDLSSKFDSTGYAPYKDFAPYCNIDHRGFINPYFDISRVYLIEQKGFKLDPITRDLLLVFSKEQSHLSTIELPLTYGWDARIDAAKRLLRVSVPDICACLTPALKMVLRFFGPPNSSLAKTNSAGVLSKEFLWVYEVALHIRSLATLGELETIAAGSKHPKLINWVEPEGAEHAEDLQKRLGECIVSMRNEFFFIDPPFDITAWVWNTNVDGIVSN